MEQAIRVGNRSAYEWLAALPAFLVLVFVVILNTSHALHAQLLQVGESIWDGYFMLRSDPTEPSCNIQMDIDAQLAALVAEAAAEEDEWDLFDAEPVDEQAMRQSLVAAQQQCETKHQQYAETIERITPGVEIFRSIELGVAQFGEIGMSAQRIMLAVLVLICGLTALFRRHHIALRPMETVMDYRVSSAAQLLASAILFYSVYSFRDVAFS